MHFCWKRFDDFHGAALIVDLHCYTVADRQMFEEVGPANLEKNRLIQIGSQHSVARRHIERCQDAGHRVSLLGVFARSFSTLLHRVHLYAFETEQTCPQYHHTEVKLEHESPPLMRLPAIGPLSSAEL